jgi:hypothetical protein
MRIENVLARFAFDDNTDTFQGLKSQKFGEENRDIID